MTVEPAEGESVLRIFTYWNCLPLADTVHDNGPCI